MTAPRMACGYSTRIVRLFFGTGYDSAVSVAVVDGQLAPGEAKGTRF